MIGAVASLFVMFGAAQNPSVCLAFDDALTAAADNDPAVDIARADLANAQAGLEEARSLYRPQLSAFARTGVGDTGLVDSQFENQFGFRASQRVFDFGDAGLARRATREGVNARKSDVLGARDEAALSAGVAFLNWSRATEQLAATAERGAYFERQLEAVEEALAEGGATVVDRAEVASEKAAAEAARFELELGRRQAAVALESLTGETAPPCQTTTSSAGEVAAAWDDPARIERIIERAVAANPNLEALRRSSASLDAQAQRQARARLPVLDVVGIASFASQNFDGGLDFQNRVGVNVSVPLYSGNALGARTRQAESRAARAYGEVAQAERLLREDVTIAYQRVLLLSAQAERQAEVRDLKLQQFEGAEAEQRIGRRTLPELVEIRLEFEGAAIAEINARYALRLEALRLDALTGDILKGR